MEKKIHYLTKVEECSYYIKKMTLTKKFLKNMSRQKQFDNTYYIEKVIEPEREDFLITKPWEKISALDDLFVMQDEDNKPKIFLFGGKLIKTKSSIFLRMIRDEQYKILQKYISENDEIIELGCGYGRRLFALKQIMKNNFEGYDFSKNSIYIANKMNLKFHTNIKFGIVDLKQEFSQIINEEKIIFTYHCLEGLKLDTKRVILNILKCKPKCVLHFEPVPELYGLTIRDTISKLFVKGAAFQDNLLKTLKSLEEKKIVTIKEVRRLGHNRLPLNESTLIVWEPFTEKS